MSKIAKLGIIIIILLAIFPVYVFFNHTGAEGKDTSSMHVWGVI
jgi:hypothetical protein